MEGGVLLMLLVLGAFIFGCLGAFLGSRRGETGVGFVLGFLLGPIGCLVAVLLPPRAVNVKVRPVTAVPATERRRKAAMDPVDLWEEEQRGGPEILPLPDHLKRDRSGR